MVIKGIGIRFVQKGRPMDLIDRKRALEEMTFSSGIEQDCVLYVPLRDVNNHLKSLPSVQPDIVYCKECVYADENYHCDYMTTWNDGDCFCCYGKRRTDGRFDQ